MTTALLELKTLHRRAQTSASYYQDLSQREDLTPFSRHAFAFAGGEWTQMSGMLARAIATVEADQPVEVQPATVAALRDVGYLGV